MKYITVKIGGIITQIAKPTDVKSYTIGIMEIMFPDNTDKWTKKQTNAWIAENNKRMESICNFLNESKL